MVRRRRFWAAAGTTVLALVMLSAVPSAGGTPRATAAPLGIPGCSGATLSATSFASSSDGWAVGYRFNGTRFEPLTMHWNGSAWKRKYPPTLSGEGYLYGVATTPTGFALAVGARQVGNAFLTYALKWNGTQWTQVSTPDPDASYDVLSAVSIVAPDDAWAVGSSNLADSDTLVLHWDGSSWTQVAAPNPGSSAFLDGVSAANSSNAWAVGANSPGTLVLHWNGSSWKHVSAPNPGQYGGLLAGVTTGPQGDAWSAGWFYAYGPPYERTLTEHWNGAQWIHQASPNPSMRYNNLNAIDEVGATDVWAVGQDRKSNRNIALAEHWDGTSWTHIPVLDPPTRNTLEGVAAVQSNDVWAVGSHRSGSGDLCLLEHWDGSSWTRYLQ